MKIDTNKLIIRGMEELHMAVAGSGHVFIEPESWHGEDPRLPPAGKKK